MVTSDTKRLLQTISIMHNAPIALRIVSVVFLFLAAPVFLIAAENEPVKYIGPGSCAATSCHGSVKPVAGSRILQNEYSTWILKDKHRQAYQALTGNVGERMARILQLGVKAEEAPKCLACHTLYSSPEQKGRAFEISEGVSCENCHGPASAWLGPHTTRAWAHDKSISLGMYDTRNVIHRTEKCMECHLGTKDKFVDHEMIAAGHPDLFFELDSFSAVMPRHWKVPRESEPDKPAEDGAWVGVRDWSTGQAAQLRAEMERLTWRAKGQRFDKKDVWPEYSELSCFACHHSLGPAKDSWRQERGYVGRRPGDPAWNSSRYVVFRLLAAQVDSVSAQELGRQLNIVSAEMSKLNPDRNVVASRCCIASRMMLITFPSLTSGRPNKRPWLWTRSSSPIVGMRIPRTPPMSARRSTAFSSNSRILRPTMPISLLLLSARSAL